MPLRFVLQPHTTSILFFTLLGLVSADSVYALPDLNFNNQEIATSEAFIDTKKLQTQELTETILAAHNLEEVNPTNVNLEKQQQPSLLAQSASQEPLQTFSESEFNETYRDEREDEALEKLSEYLTNGTFGDESLDQVVDVNQLRDIDIFWLEALEKMVNKYGCMVGYPDNTFRGNRPISRYEFAAALSTCLDNLDPMLAESGEQLPEEDLNEIKLLRQRLTDSLNNLRIRVDALEDRVSSLEDSQFSTTTKFSGEAIFAFSDLAIDGTPRLLSRGTANGVNLLGLTDNDDSSPVFGGRGRIWLRTSFSGKDLLLLRLTTSGLIMFDDANELTGRNIPGFESLTGETTQTFNIGFNTATFMTNNVTVSYSLPLGNKTQAHVFAAGGIWSDFVPTLNPYFEDYDGGNGALSTFASNNPIYRIGGGAGVGFNFDLDFLESLLGPARLSVGYLSGSANATNLGGLFSGDYAVLAQMDFQLSDNLALGLTYNHGYHPSNTAVFDMGGIGSQGVVGSAISNTAASGATIPKITNAYGVEMAWKVSDAISFSGFFTYVDAHAPAVQSGDYEIWTYGLGLAFPDLFKEGALLGMFVGAQPYVAGFDSEAVTFRNDVVPRHLEFFYRYPLMKNISLTPGVIFFTSPNQIRAGGSITTLRATFKF